MGRNSVVIDFGRIRLTGLDRMVDMEHRPYLFPHWGKVASGRGDRLAVEFRVTPELGPSYHPTGNQEGRCVGRFAQGSCRRGLRRGEPERARRRIGQQHLTFGIKGTQSRARCWIAEIGGSAMRRVKFSIDGQGPFEGAIRRGTLSEGEIEFTALPVRATEFTGAKTIRIEPEGGPEFEASVVRITTEGGYRQEADDTMTGYVVFKSG